MCVHTCRYIHVHSCMHMYVCRERSRPRSTCVYFISRSWFTAHVYMYTHPFVNVYICVTSKAQRTRRTCVHSIARSWHDTATIYTYVYIFIWIHVYICTYVYLSPYIYRFIRVYSYIYICIYTHPYTCKYIYVYTWNTSHTALTQPCLPCALISLRQGYVSAVCDVFHVCDGFHVYTVAVAATVVCDVFHVYTNIYMYTHETHRRRDGYRSTHGWKCMLEYNMKIVTTCVFPRVFCPKTSVTPWHWRG